MRRLKIAIWHLGIMLLLAQGTPLAATGDLQLISTFEGGKLHRAGQVNVLELHGAFRQMGRQYGHLLKDQLQAFYRDALEAPIIKKGTATAEEMSVIAHKVYDFYPKRFKDLFLGMAETSGLDLEKHIRLNVACGFILETPPAQCSAIAAWGDYTGGKPLVFGRNWDLPRALFKDLVKLFTIVVFNPADGNPVADINFPGSLMLQTAMNKEGLFLEFNNGLFSGGSISFENRKQVNTLLLEFLFDCDDMREIDAGFHTGRANAVGIVNVADKAAAYAYEWPTFGLKKRVGDRNGLLVETNHFVDPGWGLGELSPAVEKVLKTIKRRNHLLSLGDKFKGKIDVGKMKEIMEMPIDQGGAAFPEGTLYHLVAVPGELKWWLKIPGFQDWTEIDFKKLCR